MIKLYQFAPGFGLPNPSPFCMKVETYLRMTGLPYESVVTPSPRRGPKGKLPFIEDQGTVIADSSDIVAYLKRTYGDPLDAHLTPSERALALFVQRLLEEHLYWSVLYSRWMDDAYFSMTAEVFLGGLAPELRTQFEPAARKAMGDQLYGHGMGRHSAPEVYAHGQADLDALSVFLAEKPFFLGAQPTALDATAYAFLANLVLAPLETPLKRHAMTLANLPSYCARMKQRYYA